MFFNLRWRKLSKFSRTEEKISRMRESEDASESKETWNRDHSEKKMMRKNKSALGWRMDFAPEHILKSKNP